MHYEHEGMSLWYGMPDTPAPEGAVHVGSDITVTIAIKPADASNKVELLYRRDQGTIETVTAKWLRHDLSHNAQYFIARFPVFRVGDTVEYTVVCYCAGRQVPSHSEAQQLASSFHVVASETKPRASLTAEEASRPDTSVMSPVDIAPQHVPFSVEPLPHLILQPIQTSGAQPDLVDFNNQLYLAWTGTDPGRRLNVAASSDGVHFSSPLTFEHSDHGPALANTQLPGLPNQLFIAWIGKGGSGQGLLNIQALVPSGPVTTLNQTSGAQPALAFFNNQLYLAWTGTNGQLNVAASFDGVHFSIPATFEQSDYGPALAVFNNQLFIAWTGTNGQLNVMSFTNGGPAITLDETSGTRPALAVFAGGTMNLFVAWTGTDPGRQLNVAASGDGVHFSSPATFEHSDNGPALASANLPGIGNKLYIAWTGKGGSGEKLLNVMFSNDGVHFH